MSMAAATCMQCGREIKVDDTRESVVCNYCGTTMITEKVIRYRMSQMTRDHSFLEGCYSVDMLLLIARRELHARQYAYVYKCLDRAISMPEGKEKIKRFLEEAGIYKQAEAVIKRKEYIGSPLETMKLLTRYDGDNRIGWQMAWQLRSDLSEYVEVGERLIRMADKAERSMYEKMVYTCFAEEGSKKNDYELYLSAIPAKYIRKNKFLQDILVNQVLYLRKHHSAERNAKIDYICKILPTKRVNLLMGD